MSIMLYILSTLAANYTADWWLHIGPVQTAVGTLLFGATFTLRDRVHQHGRRVVYAMIAVAAVANVAMSILLGVPLRIIAASFLSICLSETADTEVFQALRARAWWLRVAGSNALSIPLDTVVFTLLAFGGLPEYPAAVLLAIIIGDTITKAIIGGIVALWRPRSFSATATISDSPTSP